MTKNLEPKVRHCRRLEVVIGKDSKNIFTTIFHYLRMGINTNMLDNYAWI
jgi:hypothetical protein